MDPYSGDNIVVTEVCMAEVILKNITKMYEGDVKAVDNVNIHINDKEFCVFVGPSGCK